MKTVKNAGLIDCCETVTSYEIDQLNQPNGFHLKKVLSKTGKTDHIKDEYPQSEIVNDEQSILNDDSIDLVIVKSPGDEDRHLVARALEAGKQVRIL